MLNDDDNLILERWKADWTSGDISRVASSARDFAEVINDPRKEFTFTVADKLWHKIDEIGDDLIEAQGNDPRNAGGAATFKIKGDSELIPVLQNCKSTLVGVIVETHGARWAFYVKQFDYEYQNGAWVGTAHLVSIWDVLEHLIIWPTWWLPIQAQPFSHAIYFGGMCSTFEAMAAEQALRIQSGMWEFINNALSLNPDVRAWFGTLLQGNGNLASMLKTPIYVVRTNPLTDTSPLLVRTVRMETVGAVIRENTKAYGVDVSVDLWLPGDAQPDVWTRTIDWMALDQPTYVITVKDRSQIKGPTGTVIDSVLRTVVDFGGTILGNLISGIIKQVPGMDGFYQAPQLGVHYNEPWAVVLAPEPGEKSPLIACKISDHTPNGWQHIVGGRSPRWLNNLFNILLSWLIDSISIVIGITGLPSNLLEGFMNNAFLAFQLIQLYDRRDTMGPYHPCIETFKATTSPPYNIETLFEFINIFWDTRGYTSATFTFRNTEPYTLGRDVFRGGLISLVYMGRTKIYTDYITDIQWRISAKERDVFIQVGDGSREESPLTQHQKNITGLFEAWNVVTLAPQN